MLKDSQLTSTSRGSRRVKPKSALLLALGVSALLVVASALVVLAADPVKLHLDHWGNGGVPQSTPTWRDGNLHSTNSHYQEGDADPTRFVMENLPSGSYSITFSWLAAKKQGKGPASSSVKHAHDYLVGYLWDNVTGGNPLGLNPGSPFSADPCLALVQGGKNPICTLGTFETANVLAVPIPKDNQVGAIQQAQTGAVQNFLLYNVSAANVVGATLCEPPAGATCGGYKYTAAGGKTINGNPFGDTAYNQLTINFTTPGNGQPVILSFAGHLARAVDWGDGTGAADINGAPYHWSYDVVKTSDGSKVATGNRDRSIMVIRKGSIEIEKICPEGVTGGPFTFDVLSQPLTFPDGLPSSFDLACGDSIGPKGAKSQGVVLTGGSGTYSFKETTVGTGFFLANVTCDRYAPDGTNLGPENGFTKDLAARTFSFIYTAGDVVICSVNNQKGAARILLEPNEATNNVNVNHVVTATVQKNETGTFVGAGSGIVVTFSLVNNNAGAVFVPAGANTCTTNASSQCTITIVSATGGTVDIHASATVSVLGADTPVSTGNHVKNDTTTDAQKLYVGPSPTILTVVKCVVNDDSGTKTPENFAPFYNKGTQVNISTWSTASCPTGTTGTAKSFEVPLTILQDGSGNFLAASYDITETLAAGYTQVSNNCKGSANNGDSPTCYIVNNDNPINGFMTGGGSLLTAAGQVDINGGVNSLTRTTMGFELHCPTPNKGPNNLQINYDKGSTAFHLDTLTSAKCYLDASPYPPNAAFNRYVGTGTGHLNAGKQPCDISWTFIDNGEPANSTGGPNPGVDTGKILITCGGQVKLNIDTTPLTFGNYQAH